MPRLAVLAVVVAPLPPAVSGGAPAKEPRVVRPVLWWSDLGRVSDGGGPAFKATTQLIGDAKGFAKAWEQLGLKGPVPRVNFKDYFVVVVFRESGITFELLGGLAIDSKRDARVVGFPAHLMVTNAGWYSTTLAVFRRQGIVRVEGQQLPVAE